MTENEKKTADAAVEAKNLADKKQADAKAADANHHAAELADKAQADELAAKKHAAALLTVPDRLTHLEQFLSRMFGHDVVKAETPLTNEQLTHARLESERIANTQAIERAMPIGATVFPGANAASVVPPPKGA